MALSLVKAKRLVVFLDACHSGGAVPLKEDRQRGEVGFGYIEKTLERLAQGAAHVLIASTRSSETSAVLRGSRNSVFTGHLLEALKGQMPSHGDGLIRNLEVFNHVVSKVRTSVSGQHPVFASKLEDTFP